jgi:Secretion system C-terminal sorting domain
MKIKIYILAFLIFNFFSANAHSKSNQILFTIFYSASPACVSEGNFLDVAFVEDPIGIDPGTDLDYTGGIFSSTEGLVIDPTTGQIDAGASLPGIYLVRYINSSVSLRTTVKLLRATIPTFDPIENVCKGGTAPALPTKSINGISGTWNPSVINTSALGSIDYFFTPVYGSCATSTSIKVTITETLVVPTFDPIATTYCLNEVAPTLPTTSTNGIVGTWIPSVINTSSVGSIYYTFFANTGQCIENVRLTVTVKSTIPDFQDINLATNYQSIPVLPTTSPNGISGTWSPSTIDGTITANYTFTPYSGICGTQKTITVTRSYPIANIPPPLQTCSTVPGFGSFYLIDNNNFINTNSGLHTVEYFPTLALAQSTSPIGSLPIIDYVNTTPFNQTIYARVTNKTNANNYHSVVPVQLVVNSSGRLEPMISAINNEYNVYVDENNNVVQPVTLSTSFQGSNLTCTWSRDGVSVASSPNTSFVINTFTGLNVPKNYYLLVINNNNPGCNGVSNVVKVNQIRVPTPTGNATQNFIIGQTLENLIVIGSNIRWYSSAVPSASTLLLLNTPLVNGTTYYATQTIGGAQSPGVFGVTANSTTLSNVDFNFIDLKYSPNPVIDVLNIQSQESIKNISIFNILGQEVYTRKYNDSEIKLDLSSLISGNYFAKIETDNKQQVFKIIKK